MEIAALRVGERGRNRSVNTIEKTAYGKTTLHFVPPATAELEQGRGSSLLLLPGSLVHIAEAEAGHTRPGREYAA